MTQCNGTDYTGENYYLELVSTLWRHWPGQDHGPYCDSATSPSDPRYCSAAGLNRYEPLLAEAFLTDIIPALHQFAKEAVAVNITIQRGPKAGQVINGTEIVELLVKILFDQQYAASVGMTDRVGNSSATWVDGTPQGQLTPYTLFTDALHKMDTTFDQSGNPTAQQRKAKWKRARSQLVDQFLQVNGEGGTAQFANRATSPTLLAALGVLREQLNYHCPTREQGGGCSWASNELGRKLSDELSRPVFAALADLTDKINAHEPARRELEHFLTYALQAGSSSDALHGMLASLSDVLQLLQADGDFAPIFNAVANLANPVDDPEGAGCADRTIQVLKAMSEDRYDRYHVLDYVLPSMVTPIDGGTGLTPVEIVVEAIADIHRVDATMNTPLDGEDYRYVMKTLDEFLTSDFRGFRQLYYIVQNRPQD
ncbi:MAG: hypothetical protein DRI90_28260 [Deltaproteobacteria bacterium]|nr:MAG: hypothetical protein DRI90_28260 [Deltaproteobacteria bacterium]